jgi:hypothetical protein
VKRKAGARPNWSRKLSRPLKIPAVMTLTTLGDVRDLVEHHLPAEYRERDTCRYIAARLNEAAHGGDTQRPGGLVALGVLP